MKIRLFSLLFPYFCALVTISCHPGKFNDRYLDSLRLAPEKLEASSVVEFGDSCVAHTDDIAVIDDQWSVVSLNKGEYNLLFFNYDSSDYFYALRRGRGPGEVIQGCSLHRYGDEVFYYDFGHGACFRINGRESIRARDLIADTVCVFNNSSRPVFLSSCGDGFISGNMSDAGKWYSYYDRGGEVVSSIGALEMPDLPKENSGRISFNISSLFASMEDGSRVCAASVLSPSLSFAKNDGGNLREYKRYSNSPIGMVGGHLTSESASAFNAIGSDEHYVYVAYSGRKIQDKTYPSDACGHIIVYDWEGCVRRHFVLDCPVSSFCVSGGKMVCLSSYPTDCILVYGLPSA